MNVLLGVFFCVIVGSVWFIGGIKNLFEHRFMGESMLAILGGIALYCYAFYSYKKAFIKGSEEYLNDKKDGLYWVKTNAGKEFYKIEINTNEQTVALEADGKSKVYHFNEITNFGYETGSNNLAYGQTLVNFQKTKYYIKTTDPLAPVWYFKFLVDGSPALHGINYVNKLEKMYEKWHQILNITLNKGVH